MKSERQLIIISIIAMGLVGFMFYNMNQDVGTSKTLMAIGLLVVLVFGTVFLIFGKDLFRKNPSRTQSQGSKEE